MGCFCVTELEYGPCQRTCGLAEEGLCQAWMRDISVCVCVGGLCPSLLAAQDEGGASPYQKGANFAVRQAGFSETG